MAPAEPVLRDATVVPVALGARAYDIRIGDGLLGEAGAAIAALGARRAGIVTDDTVAGIHLPALVASLEAAGLQVSTVTVPAGEGSKSFSALERVVDGLLSARIERRDVVVALGGGVVGDLAGFAAAILRRGVRVVQVPTTLLAQVDSSVGGKTGINVRQGKNLIGAFHQPALVLIDTATLDTLPAREMRAGYAEVAKYGLIDDPGFFDWLERDWQAVFAGGAARARAIATGCAAKAAIVARDEFETGDRALLNLGHTFGHALEAEVRYDGARLVHGEAVAIGLALAFRFSERLGLTDAQEAHRVARHLAAAGLPTRLADVPGGAGDPDALLAHMYQDKKVAGGTLTFILTRGIGRAFVARDVDPAAVREFLAEEFARA